MLAFSWLRLLIGSLGMLVWLSLYMLVRFGDQDLRAWRTPLRVVALLLAVVWVSLWVTDHERIAWILEPNWLGLLAASSWLGSHYRLPRSPAVTMLNVSGIHGRKGDGAPDEKAQEQPPS